jgi:hypothetical protein
MSQGYGASVHINLLRVKFQLVHAVHVHRSESFIDLQYGPSSSEAGPLFFHQAYLEQIYIFLRKAKLCQDFRNGNSRSNAHDTGSQTCTCRLE